MSDLAKVSSAICHSEASIGFQLVTSQLATDTPRPARMRKFPKQTRSRLMVVSIKQAALEVLNNSVGLADLKVIDVADTCGVSSGSIYQYFDCLESIIAAIYEDIILAVLSDRGTNLISRSDQLYLTSVLTQLDQRFGVKFYHKFYSRHVAYQQFACDAAKNMILEFECYLGFYETELRYWRDYIGV